MKGCFSTEPAGKEFRRRSVLRLGLAGLASFAANPALAALEGVRERKLSLHNLHTGETIRTTFWADGVFQIDALRDIDFVLRDFRTGDVSEIDPQLLVLLHRITQAAGVDKPFEVISGYRSPKTNAALGSGTTLPGSGGTPGPNEVPPSWDGGVKMRLPPRLKVIHPIG